MSEPSPTTTIDQVVDAAAVEARTAGSDERRSSSRHAYHALIVVILLQPNGRPAEPLLVRTKDICTGGMCILSRQMLRVGQQGAVRLRRSDGTSVVLGVEVRHCRYVGKMRHETGLRFIAAPGGLCQRDFEAGKERMIHDPETRTGEAA